jgi:hypothetical protein
MGGVYGNPPFTPVVRDAKAQELPLLRSSYCALRFVYLQPKLSGQEPAYTGHNSRPSAVTVDINVTVVRVAAEPMASPRKFLVEVVKHQVAQQWRKRTPLRSSLVNGSNQTVFHHPCAEKRPDEFKHSLRGNWPPSFKIDAFVKSPPAHFRSWFDLLRYLRTGFTTNGKTGTYSRNKPFPLRHQSLS